MISVVLLFPLAFCSCYGALTISPSGGTLTAVAQTQQTIRCSFPAVLGSARVFYDQSLSAVIDVAFGFFTPISISIGGGETFDGLARGLGIENSIATFQLAFNATSNYNGSSLRCQFLDSASGNITTSNSLLLRVLSSPCCNVSGRPIERTTIDQPSVLQLNCSGIIDEPGDPPASITWTLSSPTSSSCDGVESGKANQLYTISPISRKCTNVTITCVADTGDSRLSITRQSFDLIIKSPPGSPVCNYDGLERPLAVFSWTEPKDTGGFPVTNYSLTINGSRSISSRKLVTATVEDGDIVDFEVLAQNSLGSGPFCQLRVTIPSRSCIVPTKIAATRMSLTVACSEPSSNFVSGGYTVYYSANGVSKSQPADSLPIEITGLTSNTTYSIFVEADNSEGMRENSSTVMLSTNPPGQPGSASLTSDNVQGITATSFTLVFNSVEDAGRDNATVTKYRVFVDDQLKEFASQNGDTQIITIDHLTPETVYKVKVVVINNLGEVGHNSSAISITTSKEIDGLSGGAIAGICIGCLVLVIVVIIIVIWCVKFRPSSKNEEPTDEKRNTGEESVNKKKGGGDGVQYAELELAQAGPPPVKENRTKDAVTYSDVKSSEPTQYAELDLAKQTPEKEEKNLKKVKKAKEEESVPYTGVTKLADH